MEKRSARTAWYLYDVGNTIIEFAIALYLTQWLVVDLGLSGKAFGAAFASSCFLVAICGPYVGLHADRRNQRFHWFLGSSLATAFFVGSLSYVRGPTPAWMMVALLAAMAGNYFFHAANILYNAGLLNAARGGAVERVSAMGTGFSYIGAACGIAIIELFISGRVWGLLAGRRMAFLIASCLFLVCTTPSLRCPSLWERPPGHAPGDSGRVWTAPWRRIKTARSAGAFLMGFFLLSAAITGLSLYLPLHIRILTSDSHAPTLIMALVVVFAATGAFSVTKIHLSSANFGRAILLSLGPWVSLVGVLALAPSYGIAVAAICGQALFAGGLLPSLRAGFAMSFPESDQAVAFGFFGLSQKMAAGMGALVWPFVSGDFNSISSIRLGVACLAGLGLISIPCFVSWSHSKKTETAPSSLRIPGSP